MTKKKITNAKLKRQVKSTAKKVLKGAGDAVEHLGVGIKKAGFTKVGQYAEKLGDAIEHLDGTKRGSKGRIKIAKPRTSPMRTITRAHATKSR